MFFGYNPPHTRETVCSVPHTVQLQITLRYSGLPTRTNDIGNAIKELCDAICRPDNLQHTNELTRRSLLGICPLMSDVDDKFRTSLAKVVSKRRAKHAFDIPINKADNIPPWRVTQTRALFLQILSNIFRGLLRSHLVCLPAFKSVTSSRRMTHSSSPQWSKRRQVAASWRPWETKFGFDLPLT